MGLTRPKLAQVTTTSTSFNDPVIVINANASNLDSNTKDIGVVFERGSDLNKVLLWDESNDEFIFASSTEQGATSGDVVLSSYASLHINMLTASSMSVGNLAYPTADGAANQVLATNGSGTLSWLTVASTENTLTLDGTQTVDNKTIDGGTY